MKLYHPIVNIYSAPQYSQLNLWISHQNVGTPLSSLGILMEVKGRLCTRVNSHLWMGKDLAGAP